MRRLTAFPCAGDTLAATLDEAPGATGLLIVSGGNEIRVGAHRGMAGLAAAIAAQGHPVFRYDRRGIGDSTGENKGFESSLEDIREAANAFRRELPHVTRIVAFGNCDAASALILFHAATTIDALVLTNPWTIEQADPLPPAAAIRSRYLAKLRSPREWLRLASGGVDLRKLVRGLRKASARPAQPAAGLPARMAAALGQSAAPATILLANGDNTAIAFADHWQGGVFAACRARVALHRCDTHSHSFARPQDQAWLVERVLAALV